MLALLLPAAYALAQEAYEAGDVPRAQAQLAIALAEDPDCAWCHYLAGNLFARRGDDAGAEREWRRTAELDPETSVHHELGELALRQGDESGAAREFAADLAVHADCYEARINLAALLLKAGHAAQPAREYAVSLRYHPDDVRAKNGLRRARLQQSLPFAAAFALCCLVLTFRKRTAKS